MEYGLGTPVGDCCGCSSPDQFPQTAVTIQCDCAGQESVAQSSLLDCSLLKMTSCPQDLVIGSVTFSGSWSKSAYNCLSQCCYDGCAEECTGCHEYSDTTGSGANSAVTATIGNEGEIRITTTVTGSVTTETGCNYVCILNDEIFAECSGSTSGTVTESAGGEAVFRIVCADPSADGCDGQFKIVADNHLLICEDPCQPASCAEDCTESSPCAGLSCCHTCTAEMTYVFQNLDGETLWTHTHTHTMVPCFSFCAVCDGGCSCTCGDTCGDSSASFSFSFSGTATILIGFQ